MIKNNFKNIIYALVIGLSFVFSYEIGAKEKNEDLYLKVFGKKVASKETKIDVVLGDFFIGEVRAWLLGEKIQKISTPDLEKILIDKIRPDKQEAYKLEGSEVEPSTLPFKIVYHPSELRLSVQIPSEDLKPQDANVYDDLIPHYSRKAVDAAPFSLGVNYKVEQTNYNKIAADDSLAVQTDSFMTVGKVSFENQMNYLSTRKKEWSRQNSKMIFDRPHRMQRFELGDIGHPIIGHQQYMQMGGVSFYRDFSLNPYRAVTPMSAFEYKIESRSLVRTFVNNILLKTEYMNAGQYAVNDIPLNNGLNNIVIEATDEFGNKKTFIFNESSSLDLLAPGVSRYSISGGYPSSEEDGEKKYDEKNGVHYSSFYQHGLSKFWTLGGYVQGNEKYHLAGANQIFSTSFGNWGLDVGRSKNNFNSGYVFQGLYQLNMFGAYWYDSHTFTASYEHRTPWFNESGLQFKNRFDWTGNASYSVPFFERFNMAIAGTYQNPTLADAAKISYNASVTTKIFDSSSLTFYMGKSRDEFKVWSTQMYFFFNMTFGGSSTFASAFYDKESQTKRITLIKDNGKKLNDVKIAATADDSENSQQGSLDIQYNTVLADLGARQEMQKQKINKRLGSKTSFRFLSSFAFVHNGEDFGFSIARPISNSFVIFKPHPEWKNQKFGVQTSSGINDTKTGLFGESLISGLSPYQYRRLQLDPTELDPGYSLGQESFVVYPRKNSGHLFVVGKSGMLSVRGKIVDKSGKPLVLKMGYWTSASGKSQAFFTGREGEFLLEGVEPISGVLQIDDEKFQATNIDLSGKKQGLVDIGNIAVMTLGN